MRRTLLPLFALLAVALIALALASGREGSGGSTSASGQAGGTAPAAKVPPGAQTAVFAGGCFWCMETAFEGTPGIFSVISGYAGGSEVNPTYEQVGSGTTGHAEAVEVVFDPSVIGYDRLLSIFWHNIDPLAVDYQFCDHGPQYRSAIFWRGPEQKAAAEASKRDIASSMKFSAPIATQIVEAGRFYPAEEYHQDYYRKNPVHYQTYRLGCRRDARLREIWGAAAGHATGEPVHPAAKPVQGGPMSDRFASYRKPSEEELRKRLTPLQFEVTQHESTERAFANPFQDNHEAGIYVDIVSGEPLFSSLDKYDSGTGWPSFTKPLERANVVERTDTSLFVARTEVRSKHADSHLGHLFDDGPAPTGMRYCMNSASLRFIPVARLEAEGYGQYLPLFTDAR